MGDWIAPVVVSTVNSYITPQPVSGAPEPPVNPNPVPQPPINNASVLDIFSIIAAQVPPPTQPSSSIFDIAASILDNALSSPSKEESEVQQDPRQPMPGAIAAPSSGMMMQVLPEQLAPTPNGGSPDASGANPLGVLQAVLPPLPPLLNPITPPLVATPLQESLPPPPRYS